MGACRVGECATGFALASGVMADTDWAAADLGAPKPFLFADQSPTAGVYGLPRPDNYLVADNGRRQADFVVDYTSHDTAQPAGDKRLSFDGETSRAALVFKRGFGDRWQASIDVRLVDHRGGFADGFIDDFPDTFGFADGGRSHVRDDRQHVRYERNGRLSLDASDSPSGIGDWGTAVAGELKRPTGDADRLTGSASADVAVSATIGNNQSGWSDWRLAAGAGALYTGEGNVLAAQRVQTVAFGWATIDYALTDALVVQMQANSYSAFYEDTSLKALTALRYRARSASTGRRTERTALAFAIIEDMNTGAAPDVSLTLALHHGF